MHVKLWKRYIDDCGGVFLGRNRFQYFFNTLNTQFNKFDLQLTYETSSQNIHLLDIDIFIENDTFQTKEFRKETSSNSYVKFGSAHPKHCFKGIIKSQMYRLRRLCSKNDDFIDAIQKLRQRCINSGYETKMIDEILSQADSLERIQEVCVVLPPASIKWVVLSGTVYEKRITDFARRINAYLKNKNIKIEIIKSTGSSLSKLIFNNNVKPSTPKVCTLQNCTICSNSLRPDADSIVSPTNGRIYKLNPNLSCLDSGIYCIASPCVSLYTGKTTHEFNKRFDEHFRSKSSAVLDHSTKCEVCRNKCDFSIKFLESMYSRGKYSLSEREYLWNERLRGILNIQKTLKK